MNSDQYIEKLYLMKEKEMERNEILKQREIDLITAVQTLKFSDNGVKGKCMFLEANIQNKKDFLLKHLNENGADQLPINMEKMLSRKSILNSTEITKINDDVLFKEEYEKINNKLEKFSNLEMVKHDIDVGSRAAEMIEREIEQALGNISWMKANLENCYLNYEKIEELKAIRNEMMTIKSHVDQLNDKKQRENDDINYQLMKIKEIQNDCVKELATLTTVEQELKKDIAALKN